jgi:hypothetical protein
VVNLKQAEKNICKGGSEERAVDDVEDAAVAGDELAAVFYFGVALDETFEQVAELADAADYDAEDDSLPPCEVVAGGMDVRGA